MIFNLLLYFFSLFLLSLRIIAIIYFERRVKNSHFNSRIFWAFWKIAIVPRDVDVETQFIVCIYLKGIALRLTGQYIKKNL